MTAALETVLDGLADAFDLDRELLGQATALERAALVALEHRTAEKLVGEVVGEGPLRGVANPYGVVIARVRRLGTRPPLADSEPHGSDAELRSKRLVASYNHGGVLRCTGVGLQGAREILCGDRRYDDPEMREAALRGFRQEPLR